MPCSLCSGQAVSGGCCRDAFHPGARYTIISGFGGDKLGRGRKRHILVDTLGLPIASRVEPANVPDQRAGAWLLGGLRALFPAIQMVMANAEHEGWRLIITRRGQRAFKIKGLAWIVERTFAWLGRKRRFSACSRSRLSHSPHSVSSPVFTAACAPAAASSPPREPDDRPSAIGER